MSSGDNARRPDGPSVADLAIDALAQRERDLLERVASLEAEADIARELAREACRQLYDLTSERKRIKEAYDHLLDECRELRAAQRECRRPA
jgi:hypothetical protein